MNMDVQLGRNNTVWIWGQQPINDMIMWCIDTYGCDCGWWVFPQMVGKKYHRIKFDHDSDLMLFMLRWA